jgi:hypothetical protein
MSSLDVTLNVENVKFCPGPCKCTTYETKPIVVTYETESYSDNSYTYPMLNGGLLTLENVRMCAGCNHRYLDMMDNMDNMVNNEYYDVMSKMYDDDAKTIVAKLRNNT